MRLEIVLVLRAFQVLYWKKLITQYKRINGLIMSATQMNTSCWTNPSHALFDLQTSVPITYTKVIHQKVPNSSFQAPGIRVGSSSHNLQKSPANSSVGSDHHSFHSFADALDAKPISLIVPNE